MEGVLGYIAWRWYAPSSAPRTMRSNLDRLFYIEGALTISTALVAAFVLPDFPSTSHRWLSPVEAKLTEK
jgi:hypothetical protein